MTGKGTRTNPGPGAASRRTFPWRSEGDPSSLEGDTRFSGFGVERHIKSAAPHEYFAPHLPDSPETTPDTPDTPDTKVNQPPSFLSI